MTRDRRPRRRRAPRCTMINPAPVQRRGAARGARPATSPRPSCTTSAATSRCPRTTARSQIGGAVENPITLTLDDLRAMPAVERAVTLECAGNGRLDMRPLPTGEPWGDYAVSTARWTGALPARRPGAGAARRRTASTSGSRAPTTARTTSADPRRDRRRTT